MRKAPIIHYTVDCEAVTQEAPKRHAPRDDASLSEASGRQIKHGVAAMKSALGAAAIVFIGARVPVPVTGFDSLAERELPDTGRNAPRAAIALRFHWSKNFAEIFERRFS